MDLTKPLRLILNSTLTLLYPRPCLVCGASVESQADGVACDRCWAESLIFSGNESICSKCGRLCGFGGNVTRQAEVSCRLCNNEPFSAARSCGAYEKALRASVLALKREPYVPKRIATLLVSAAQRPPLDSALRVIPVPLHPAREAARGFNQASVIAAAITRLSGRVLDEVSLARVVHTTRHRVGMDAKGRRETVENAFVVRHPKLVRGQDILLVDDVFTTGATASSCASVLLSAGARKVFVLTISRTTDRF